MTHHEGLDLPSSRARRREGAAAAGAPAPAVGTGATPAVDGPRTASAPSARSSLLRTRAALALGGLASVLVLPVLPGHAATTGTFVVRGDGSGSLSSALAAVRGVGGSVTSTVPLIGGVVAELSDGAAAALAADGVTVTPDASVRLTPVQVPPAATPTTSSAPSSTAAAQPAYDPTKDVYSLRRAEESTGVLSAWSRRVTGAAVRVAVIDSGITAVPGLDAPGKVLRGADLSFDAVSDERRHQDGYGHGTHLAGIIAGDDAQGKPAGRGRKAFTGVAPDAQVVSVKVGDSAGHVDVSQVLAALDWTVATRHLTGVRVVNLSFNAGGLQSYTLDPLAFAVEQAWKAGLVVVVSAGNDGDALGRLQNPAQDPYVIAVGALDDRGTATPTDDVVPSFSARGDGVRNPDVVAPGRSLQSLAAPDSFAAKHGSRLGDRFVRASGTSQSAAYVSGVAALLLSQRPELTPDQVKHVLVSSARPLKGADSRAQGAGAVDVAKALATRTPGAEAVQSHPVSTGLGTLAASRGDQLLELGGKVLDGETTVWGGEFDATSFTAGLAAAVTDPVSTVGKAADAVGRTAGKLGSTLDGARSGDLSGAQWSGAQWSGAQWSGAQWSGAQWSGAQWSGAQWSGAQWSGAQWSGAQWSGAQWSGAQWSGAQWSGAQWSSGGFSGFYWL